MRAWLHLLLFLLGATLLSAACLAGLYAAARVAVHLPWEPESVLMTCLLAVLLLGLVREWCVHRKEEGARHERDR